MTEREIFEHALQIAEPNQRADYIREACGADHTLSARVGGLLAAHEAAGSFLESPAGIDKAVAGTQPPQPATTANVGSAVGDVVAGKYKLLQMIGEGGMGVVYMAEQRQPVVRRVALKIIKPGMQSAEFLARFEAERQALAVMDHPHIAKVFDAGTTDAGLPFFVMELVHGIPITRYCNEAQLTLSERLAVFVPVCQAVQHAHQKGVIHRDIKPSNVLVAQYDGKPAPKVIDFGVAKAVGQKLTERTLFTQFGSVVGTLEYMSPEQATLNALDVDTRSDIYSLGVLLYELLTGETPMDRQMLQTAAFDEVLRIIRFEEPPKPSTRLSSSTRLPAIAAQRRVEPRRLTSLVRGELDWIVMRALEKERDHRYGTVKDLAEDIERYLASQPIAAGPPSSWYRMRKFARRNRSRLLNLSAIAAVALVAAGSIFWFANRAQHLQVLVATEQTSASEAKLESKEVRKKAQGQQMLVADMGQMLGSAHSPADEKGDLNAAFGVMENPMFGEAGKACAQAMKLAMEGQRLAAEGKTTEALDTLDQAEAILKGLPKQTSLAKATDTLFGMGDATQILVGSARGMVLSSKATVLGQLHRDEEANRTWDEAIAASPLQMRTSILSALVQAGNLKKAVATADLWINQPNQSADLFIEAAKVYSRTAADTAPEVGETLRKRAIALLEQAEKQGYFGSSWARESLTTEIAWNPLRGLDEFKQLAARVTAAPPEKPRDVNALLGFFNLMFAAGNADNPTEASDLMDQAFARAESFLPEKNEATRLYIGAFRKAMAGVKLSRQGRHAEAAALFDAADEQVTELSKLSLPPELPPNAMDALREMIKVGREGKELFKFPLK